MRNQQTVKFARVRLDRFEAIRVYSFEISKSGVKRRAGVYGKGK